MVETGFGIMNGFLEDMTFKPESDAGVSQVKNDQKRNAVGKAACMKVLR